MGNNPSSSIELSTHHFPILPCYIQLAAQCAKEIASILQFNEIETNKLQVAVEEAVNNTIAHSHSSDPSKDFFDLQFRIEGEQLICSIFEKGIPFKGEQHNSFSLENLDQPGLGMHMLKRLMDKVELLIHGRDGKEIRLSKHINTSQIPQELLGTQGKRRCTKRETVEHYSFRRATTDDIPDIIRLAWKCYGYTQEALLYEPDHLRSALENEELISFVAIKSDTGEIIGHNALKYHDPKVPEMGLAFIDPTYRCPGIMWEMGKFIQSFSRDRGDDGFFDCSVTTHTQSQKGLQQIGSKPCCFMLGIAASGMQANMSGLSRQLKGHTVSHFNNFNRSEASIYPPRQHQDVIEKIYRKMDLPRSFGAPATSLPECPSEVFLVPLGKELNVAFIVINTIGADCLQKIEDYKRQCDLEKMDAAYIFLDLQHPGSPLVVDGCETLGFSFAGIMPHIHNGHDRILMQHINTRIDVENVKLHGDASRELFDYIISCLDKSCLA